MRLKSYTAPSMMEAMELVRAELGDDAIIVSTQRGAGEQGVRVTAAVEELQTDADVDLVLSGAQSAAVRQMRDALSYHGVPERLVQTLESYASHAETDDPIHVCAVALEQRFGFKPLPVRQSRKPIMLVGPPGSGKSIALSKLAARAVMNNRTVAVISADTRRAGALEQISAFTGILGVKLFKARTPDELGTHVQACMGQYDFILVDTPGLNPFHQKDMANLADLVQAYDSETVLVMAAGGDAEESAELATAFATAGATRLFATRLDITRRLGAVLMATEAGQLAFSDVSINSNVHNGLCSISPMSLARLIVPAVQDKVTAAPAASAAVPPDAHAQYPHVPYNNTRSTAPGSDGRNQSGTGGF
jgi:flagellar biosynthesis protein FlhF